MLQCGQVLFRKRDASIDVHLEKGIHYLFNQCWFYRVFAFLIHHLFVDKEYIVLSFYYF